LNFGFVSDFGFYLQEDENLTKIVIVDDDKDILRVLEANLTFEKYNVITAECGVDAYEKIKENNPDIVILDLNLPDVDGIQVCVKLRENGIDVPIIMLTARDSVSDKILGLECGADDYIVKPFNFLELNARIKSCLRRVKGENQKKLSYKSLKIFPEKNEIISDNKKIEFTKTEYNLFMFLFKNRGKICSRKDIKDALWKEKDIYGWSRTIDIHIAHIRKKLPQEIEIKAVPGTGYMFE